jgi:hypothetical protein
VETTQRVSRLMGRLPCARQLEFWGSHSARFYFWGTAGVASAADWYHDCDRRIAHEQHELDRAIAHHGYYSRQADHERRELQRLYDECRYR